MNISGTSEEDRNVTLQPLIPGTLYTLELVAVNSEGLRGPVLELDVTTLRVNGKTLIQLEFICYMALGPM